MKYFKRILLIVLVLLICVITTWFIIKKYYLFDKVHAAIERSIGEQIENDFQFTLDDFSLNLFASKAQLSGFNLVLLNETDTVGYLKGDILVNILGWRNIIFDNQKVIKNIELRETEFYYAKDHPLIMKSKEEEGNQEVEIIDVSAVGKLLFAEKHKEKSGQLATDFDVSVALNYDSKDEFSIGQLIKQITNFQFSEFHYYLSDGFHQLMIAEGAFSEFSDITLKKLEINPVDSRKDFARRKKVATEFIVATIDSIHLLDFDSRVSERIFIDQIHLFQPNIDVFKDRNYPDNQAYKSMLTDLLQEMETPVHVREVGVNNMYIKYAELPGDGKEAGVLFFSEADATISNITNIEDSVALSGNMLIEADAKFYGVGKLNTTITYELLSGSGQFNAKGSLKSMDIREVNAIVSKLMPVQIESGHLSVVWFNFSGSRVRSAGDMRFKYSGLKVKLLDVGYLDHRITRNIASSLGNRVLRNSNPSPDGTMRIGMIDQDRNTTKSMFHYWWISLKSGFASSLSLTADKEKTSYHSD